MVIIQTTVADDSEAKRLAALLVDSRLAACVQLVPIRSIYRWQGKRECSSEILLQIKTPAGRAADVKTFLEAEHAYEVPEIIEIPLTSVSDAYRKWAQDAAG